MTEVADQMDNLNLSTRVLNVFYCGVCSVPPEYCEYGSSLSKCKEWLKDNNSEIFDQMYGDVQIETEEEPQKQKQKKVAVKVVKKVVITTIERTKRKRITQVRGLELFDVDLKKASKQFASKFAASASVSKIPGGGDEILIQGECADDLFEFIVANFKGITDDDVEFGESKKK